MLHDHIAYERRQILLCLGGAALGVALSTHAIAWLLLTPLPLTLAVGHLHGWYFARKEVGAVDAPAGPAHRLSLLGNGALRRFVAARRQTHTPAGRADAPQPVSLPTH